MLAGEYGRFGAGVNNSLKPKTAYTLERLSIHKYLDNSREDRHTEWANTYRALFSWAKETLGAALADIQARALRGLDTIHERDRKAVVVFDLGGGASRLAIAPKIEQDCSLQEGRTVAADTQQPKEPLTEERSNKLLALFDKLRDQGHRVFALSDTIPSPAPDCGENSNSGQFDLWVVAAQLGIMPKEVLFIANSSECCDIAKRSGATTLQWSANPSEEERDRLIRSLDEVLASHLPELAKN